MIQFLLCRCSIICLLLDHDTWHNEAASTLQFAARAKRMVNFVTANQTVCIPDACGCRGLVVFWEVSSSGPETALH